MNIPSREFEPYIKLPNVWNEPVTDIEGWAWMVIGLSLVALMVIWQQKIINLTPEERATVNAMTDGF